MSGGISFRKGTFWGKAGWCYRAAREGICEALRETPEGCAIADEISAQSHPARCCEYLAIDEWPSEKKRLFFQAIYRCAYRFANEGPVGWRDPSLFAGFLQAMEQLVQTVRNTEAENEQA
jgi:hypothetical protein